MLSKLFQLSILFSVLLIGGNQWAQAQFPCQVTFSQIDSGNTVYFSAIDSGAFNPLYDWTIVDAVSGTTTTLTGANPMFTFSGASTNHYVCVTMTDTVYNCQTTYCDSVMTSGINTPNCSVYFNYVDSGNTVYFNALGTPTTSLAYFWQITDGNTGNTTNVWGQNPMFTFSGASTNHYACVTIIDSITNCQATYCDSVITYGAVNSCNVYFNYVDSGNTVYLSAINSGAFNPLYDWTVVDAVSGTTTTLTGANPMFTFSGASTNHYVCVTMTDTVYNCQTSYCDSVIIGGNNTSNCSVYFNYTNSNNTVYFNAVASGTNAASYFWQITDANTGTVTNAYGPTPTFTFSGGHPYHNACVTITDSSTNCQTTYCGTVVVPGTTNCSNNSVNYTTSIQGYNVVFYGNATGFDPNTVDYLWSFGTVGQVTQGTFPAGWNTICVTVSDSNCVQTFCDSFYVNPSPCNGASVSIASSYVTNNTVNFTSTITGGNGGYTYHWNLGDNNISLNANPTHTYGSPYGGYAVILTVQDSFGCVFTAIDSVFITPPVVNCNDNEVILTLNHDSYAGETSWNVVNGLGGIVASGTSYTWMNNTTTYETLCLPAGCYTLNVYDSWGDGMCCAYGSGSYVLSDTIGTVLATGGSFNFVDSRNFCVGGATNPCGNINNTTISHVLGANGSVTFSSANAGPPLTHDWLVDGNVVSTAYSPTVTLTNGVHSYCLVVMDSITNCTAIICDSILITNASTGPQGCAGIVPDMNIVQDSIDPYQLYVQPILNNVTAGSSFIFYWSFGDNSGAFGGQAAHNYNNYGSYNLCFVAIDSVSGCIINYCDTITLDSLGTFSRFINKPGFSVNTLAPILNTNINTTNLETRAWEVELFPNPVSEKVNLQINTPNTINGQINIVSATGQVVAQQTLDQVAGSSQLQLSVKDLPAGVYFVRIETAEEQQTLKFIKK